MSCWKGEFMPEFFTLQFAPDIGCFALPLCFFFKKKKVLFIMHQFY
jgi:hypothetical protein